MSRGKANIFEYLLEDDAPKKAPAKPQETKAPAKPAAGAAPKQAAAAPKEQKKADRTDKPRVNNTQTANAQRKPRENAPRRDAVPEAGSAFEEKPSSTLRSERRGGADRITPRENTRAFKQEVRSDPNKRFYERRSGTGRSQTENKKAGAGKGNWGKQGDEAVDAVAEAHSHTVEKKEDQPEETGAAEKTDEATAEAGAAESAEKKEEVKELGFSDYEAIERQKKAALEETLKSLKAKETKQRKANEGADNAQWASTTVLKRNDDEEESKKEKKAAAKEAPKKDSKVVVPVEPAKQHSDRGADRGDRRGKPRAGDKPAPKAKPQSVPDVKDKAMFPALPTADQQPAQQPPK